MGKDNKLIAIKDERCFYFKILFRIQLFYGSYRGDYHGGLGGLLTKLRLYNGDKISKVTGRLEQGLTS